ncbi:MAG: META domain-containing protein [Bacteroidota bacterium]
MTTSLRTDQFLFLALLSLLFFCSCPPAEPTSSFDASQLYRNDWQLISYTVNGQKTAASGMANLRFEQAGQLGGNSGCNSLGGDFKIKGNQLFVGPLLMTKRYCQETANQENAITRILGDTVSLAIDAEQLIISNDQGTLVYGPPAEDISQADPPKSSIDEAILAAKDWLLVRYETSGKMQDAKNLAFLSFSKEGSIGGSSGCNSFGGEIEIIGAHLVTREMAMTEAFCEEYAEQETAIAAVLGDSAEMVLHQGELHLRNQEGTLIYQPQEAASPTQAATTAAIGERASAEIGGLFVYIADSAGFQPCGDSESYPVSMEKGYLACERAYTGMEKGGEPAYIVVRGYTAPNPAPEGKRTMFVIEELVRSTAETSCP